MLPPPGQEPVRDAEEVFLVDRIEHRDDRALNELVFQRGDTERALLIGARLRYEPPPNRLRPTRAATRT